MVHPDWMRMDSPGLPSYPREYWAADWHKHFLGTDDARRTLTWKNRFTGVAPEIHNFYSSTENVLGTYAGSPTAALGESAFPISEVGSFAWVIQEKAKGRKIEVLALAHGGSDYAGWGFNLKDPENPSDPIHWKWWIDGGLLGGGSHRIRKNADEIDAPVPAILSRHPLFEPGWGRIGQHTRLFDPSPFYYRGPPWIRQLYDTTTETISGSIVAAMNRTQLLAEAIPALSLPVGANETLTFEERNYNMPVQFVNAAHWPRDIKEGTGISEWRHSDLRNVAYLYMTKLYDQLVFLSQP
jgi:hypothetical protein